MGFILIYFIIVILVIEIAVLLMRSTGLDYEISRFQVVSLMTSTGFTTKESELILGHPVRRRIGIFLILFGVFSFAVMISSISSILAPGFRVFHLAVVAAILAVVFGALRLPILRRNLESRMTKPLQQTFDTEALPIDEVLIHADSDFFVDIPIAEHSRVVGQTMDGLCTSKNDINLLFIKRGTVHIRQKRLVSPIEAGDILYLYGDKEDIDHVFGHELAERETMRKHEIESKSLI